MTATPQIKQRGFFSGLTNNQREVFNSILSCVYADANVVPLKASVEIERHELKAAKALAEKGLIQFSENDELQIKLTDKGIHFCEVHAHWKAGDEEYTSWKAGDPRPTFAPGTLLDIKDANRNVWKKHHPYEGVWWGRDSNIVGYRIAG